MKPFVNAETVLSANVRRVEFTQHDFIGNIPGGSYNVVMARLFGLSFPNFLRYCREVYGADINGRQGYSYLTFKDNEKCTRLVNELNRRWDLMLKERTKRGLSNEVENNAI